MIVKQVNVNKNVAELYYQNNQLGFILNSNGNIGIGVTNPLNKLDIIGNINTTSISINNNDISTTITNTSNNLATYILNNSNNLLTNSNNLATYILNNSNNLLTNALTNSNNLATYILNYSNNDSNNLYKSSNVLFTNTSTNSNNLATYILNTSNNSINFSITNSNQSYLNSSNNILTIINDSYCKKTTFYFSTPNLYVYNSINYYTYNIEISKFIRFIQINPNIKLAKFKIHLAPMDCIFNGIEIRECEYLIMMSDNSGVLNVRAIGTPQDTYLQKIASWKIVKSSSFNYITYISPIQNINILCTIIDEA